MKTFKEMNKREIIECLEGLECSNYYTEQDGNLEIYYADDVPINKIIELLKQK